VGSVFDVTGGVTACPVTAALAAIGSVGASELVVSAKNPCFTELLRLCGEMQNCFRS